ncbi:alpha/beta fold hydrolase [Snodgrassella sp. CFCC 13594]|uniref:alpha/beta fold hydrolase n=1 Tax=Snodgrassella sp. CFCC 13594 TaxID=1775559 RepID=UPI00082F3852|nr:alpha/beta hydrolase [Snodgrassella sp. CFCC 13594]
MLFNNEINAHIEAQSCRHQINGLCLHAWHWPAPNRPKVVLLHGWLDCAASFQFMAMALGGEWDVYAPDWRGCGLSAHQSHGYYDRALMLSDLSQWIDIISPNEPVHIMGHSMGGMLAAHYAGTLPERVKSLVVAEGFGIEEGNVHEAAARSARFLSAMSHPQPWLDLVDVAKVAAKFQQRNPLLSAERALYFAHVLTETNTSGCLTYRADNKHKIPQPLPYRTELAYAVWRHIRAPRLWVEGGLLPHNRYLQHVKQTLPQRYAAMGKPQKICFPESGHMLHWEVPEQLALALNVFWCNQAA